MRSIRIVASVAAIALFAPALSAHDGHGSHAVHQPPAAVDSAVAAAVAAPTRTPANTARDRYRNPAETLTFFGVKGGDTIVELWPGGAWYTEILAPLVQAGGGTLYVAATGERGFARIQEKQEADAALYGRLKRAEFPYGGTGDKVPDGSADVVLTFRNVHNWRFSGADNTAEAFRQIHAMLKPGGVLGVVEHRLDEDAASAREEKSGYMKESSIIAFAEAAGFQLAGRSDINANPRDTKDYEKGVWTLPPSLREGDKDRDAYLAIGESDRMTLKFVKPAN